MGVYLTTDRIILRSLTREDVSRFIEFESDPEVMRYLNGGGPPMPESHLEALIEISEKFDSAKNGLGIWAALSVFNLEFAGWFHLIPLEPGQEPELGYHLARCYWGRGIATEVASAILAKAQGLGLRTCTARAMLANTASTRVMKKLGMEYVTTYTESGFPGDDKQAVIYRWHAAESTPAPQTEAAEIIKLPWAA